MKIERITECRICGNKNLKTVVDLGVQCLSGRFPRIGEPDPPSVPLELVQCIGEDTCGLVQLAHRMPLNELYGDGYGYLSGMNQTMKKHLEEIAKKAESLVNINDGDTILDIGCNDGALLKSYHNDGLKVGMDDKHFQKYYTGSHIVFIPGFFSASLFESYKPIKHPKIITSIAMFYDLEDPNQFVSDVKKILHKGGIWILEQSYLPMMLEKNAFDTVCHEHLEYYCLKQIKWLCDKHGLKIFDYEFNDSNGGSFRVFVCHKESERKGIADTSKINLNFERFNSNINRIKEKLTRFIKREYAKGKCIHLYGASTKGNVLLQYFGIDNKLIDYAAEKNPDKWTCRTPGTRIPIISEQDSKEIDPDYYLVLPWHFRDEFIRKEMDYLRQGGKLVFPLPEPQVISMEDGEKVVRQI